jgi:hypothetical protein
VIAVSLLVAAASCSDDPTQTGDQTAATSGPAPAAWVDHDRLANADSEPHNWFMTNRGTNEDHYSPLA